MEAFSSMIPSPSLALDCVKLTSTKINLPTNQTNNNYTKPNQNKKSPTRTALHPRMNSSPVTISLSTITSCLPLLASLPITLKCHWLPWSEKTYKPLWVHVHVYLLSQNCVWTMQTATTAVNLSATTVSCPQNTTYSMDHFPIVKLLYSFVFF